MFQATVLASDLALDKSIDINVNEIMHDAGIGYSLDPIKMIENILKKMNEDILHLLFIQPQTNEIKEKVDVLVKKSKALKVSCSILNYNINSFMIL